MLGHGLWDLPTCVVLEGHTLLTLAFPKPELCPLSGWKAMTLLDGIVSETWALGKENDIQEPTKAKHQKAGCEDLGFLIHKHAALPS